MEGASSLITYLPQEEEDAKETKRRVEELGQKCHLFATDLRSKDNCKKVVDTARQQLGGIDILVNNAGTQNMIEDINDLTESVQAILQLNKTDHEQRSMGRNIRHEYPLRFLPIQIHPTSSEERLNYHQLCLDQCLHRPSRSARLHLHQGSSRRIHARLIESASGQGHSSKLRVSRTR